jgi:predicted secreted protein
MGEGECGVNDREYIEAFNKGWVAAAAHYTEDDDPVTAKLDRIIELLEELVDQGNMR